MDDRVVLTLAGYGRTVAVRVPRQAAQLVLARLPPTYRRATGSPEREWALSHLRGVGWQIRLGCGPLPTRGPTDDMGLAIDWLLSDVELWVAEHAVDRVFVHAGCVELGGRAILLPGRTTTGKSTLTAALVRAGCTYYSDEYAVLDHGGVARPYARPLALRSFGGDPARRVTAGELGGAVGSSPVPVGLIALLRFDPASEGEIRSLSPAAAVLAMTEHAVAGRTRPAAVLDALAAVAAAPAVAGTRSDADETAVLLMDLLQQSTSSCASEPAAPARFVVVDLPQRDRGAGPLGAGQLT